MFGGDGRLVFQEGADGGVALAHGKARHLLLRRGLIQQQAAQQAGPELPARRRRRGRKWRCRSAGLAGGQVRIATGWPGSATSISGARWHMPTQPTRLMAPGRPLARALAQGVIQLIAALGHAAGTQADVDLGEPLPRGGSISSVDFAACRRLPGEMVADLARSLLRRAASHDRVAHLHHGRQRATTQAGGRFDGELLRRIGVGARRNAQMPPQRLLHPLRSRDLTGRAAADLDNMFARRLVAEHVVESRNPGMAEGGMPVSSARRCNASWGSQP